MYFIILIMCFILAIYAQYKVRNTYKKFSQVPSSAGITGAQTAQRLLRENGIHDVRIEEVGGTLSDHYDPGDKVVRLSSDIYHGSHLAGLAVAAHEIGHAIQHAQGYFPLNLRHTFLPVARLGSMAAFPLLLAGFFFQATNLLSLGVLFFAATVIFQIITLPVEFNASSRAMAQLVDGRYLAPQEGNQARTVLNAAALTYVAAALTAIAQLLHYLLMFSGGSDE